MLRKCRWCGKEFETNMQRKVFCSMECQATHKQRRHNTVAKIKRLAAKNNWDIKNVDKIVRAKLMLFKKGDQYRCPCDANNPDRYCGSYLCKCDVNTQGHCHCNLFHKKDPS